MNFDIVKLTSPKLHHTFVLGLLAVVTLFYFEGTFVDVTHSFDTCHVDRFDPAIQADYRAQKSLHVMVFRMAIVSLMVFLAALTFMSNDPHPTAQPWKVAPRLDWGVVFAVGYCSVFYAFTYCVLDAAKDILRDPTCNNKHNSISGHYSFFSFYTLTLAHLALSFLPFTHRTASPKPEQPKITAPSSTPAPTTVSQVTLQDVKSPKSPFTVKLAVLCVCYAIFLLSTVFTLYSTYVWGYHSLRQIYLGLAIGTLAHVLLTFTLSRVSLRIFLPPAPTSAPTPDTRNLLEIVQTRLSQNSLTSPQAQKLFREELWPLTVLIGYALSAALICLIVTWGLPFGTWEYALLGLVLPVTCYAYIVKLNGQFAYRRDTRSRLHQD